MRLIAIYIDDYKLFHKQLLTFSSDYNVDCSLCGDDEISLVVTYDRKLPKHFFSTGFSSKECVSSVSAIIGQNGTGKTMIARLLFDLAPWGKHLDVENAVVIVELGGKLQVYTSFAKDKCHVDVKGMDVAPSIHSYLDDRFAPDLLPFKVFYYSPHYTTEQTDGMLDTEGDSAFNISTTQLMWHPEGNSETLLSDVSHLKIYNTDEKLRVLEFCEAWRNARQKRMAHTKDGHDKMLDIEIPEPQGVLISPHMEGMLQALEKMHDYVEAYRREQPPKNTFHPKTVEAYLLSEENSSRVDATVGKYFESFLPVFEKSLGCQDFFTRVFAAYVAKYIQDCGVLGAHFPAEELREGTYLAALKDFILLRTWNQAVNPMSIIRFLEANPPPLLARSDGLDRPVDEPQAKDFFQCLLKLCKLKGILDETGISMVQQLDNGLLYCQTTNKNTRNLVHQLVRLHGVISVVSPFLSFDVLPKMSSGEMAFLSMFARLYRFVPKHTRPNDNVVIFLDEAETTLHPEWQRRLVDYFIRFLEEFIPDRHYQLLFASHSPMLLSDIPAGNCCFLRLIEPVGERRKDKRAECVALQTTESFINTFGANIYDLFQHSFFLTNGAIGEFSSRVIDEQLQKVATLARESCKRDDSSPPSSDNEVVLTQALIGDRVLVRYFNVLKEFGLA